MHNRGPADKGSAPSDRSLFGIASTTEIEMQIASESVMAQARNLINDIESADSQENAEFNTLLVGAYLTQALKDRRLNRDEFDQLTRAASDSLRNWIPRPSV